MLVFKLAYEYPEEVAKLFEEYIDLLIVGDPAFRKYLDLQNYDEEILHLQQKYGLPYGRLYLAYYEGKPAGCIGLRKIDEEKCEMKRLYVRPEFRGKHIGTQLIHKIIMDAEEIGYKHMFLDTLPFLESAIHMYREWGFYQIDSYNNNPMDTSIYMKKDLS